MSCIIMGIVQCISVVLAVFIKNTIFRNLRRKTQVLTNFFHSNVEDKCFYKMRTVLYQYLSRQPELFGL